MKFLLPANKISVTVICVICFVDLFRDVSAFTSTAGKTLARTLVHRQGHYHVRSAKQSSDELPIMSSSLYSSYDKNQQAGIASDAFLKEYFQSDIDDVNLPPSMSIIHRSIGRLASGSDIRGTFVKHPAIGRIPALARSIGQTSLPALTPFAAHCLGFAFATMIKEYQQLQGKEDEEVVICIGRDPRDQAPHEMLQHHNSLPNALDLQQNRILSALHSFTHTHTHKHLLLQN